MLHLKVHDSVNKLSTKQTINKQPTNLPKTNQNCITALLDFRFLKKEKSAFYLNLNFSEVTQVDVITTP